MRSPPPPSLLPTTRGRFLAIAEILFAAAVASTSRASRATAAFGVPSSPLSAASAAASSSSSSSAPLRPSTAMSMKSDIAVVGCGVLGTSLCRQILESSDFASRKVTGITKSTSRHAAILSQVSDAEGGRDDDDDHRRFDLRTYDDLLLVGGEGEGAKFRDVVFCAPPSGFEDYPAAVKEAATKIWEGKEGGGSFVFTSSGGIYGSGNGETVTETSPTDDPTTNPRVAKLANAESACLDSGGSVLRLAGLYTLERGAHNYWLEGGNDVRGRPDGIVNLLHYDDAASACLAALRVGPDAAGGRVFLVSDGNPTTRRGICDSALKVERYRDREMPKFLGETDGPIGKVYDGTWTDEVLGWKPRYASFDEFMTSEASS